MSETTNTEAPTVVLVHGAFADASSWNGVISRLQARSVPVTAPANPLRGIAADSAYIAAVLDQIEGPVVAVGHSYGGAVISNAAPKARNVVGLVFVAAFAPEEGERLGEVAATSKDSARSASKRPSRRSRRRRRHRESSASTFAIRGPAPCTRRVRRSR